MEKPSLSLSLNPSYYCNLRCDFCYLTNEQLSNKERLSLEVLDRRLLELTSRFNVTMVDLYGGETFMLPESYLSDLKDILFRYGISDINVITNLTVSHPAIHDEDYYITVSYDGAAREKHELVFTNMLTLNKPFTILILASPDVINQNVDELIETLNCLASLENVEIKPYSANQSNQLTVSYAEYEEFVKSFITSPVSKNFTLNNERLIKESLGKVNNAYSDDHIYITPKGNFAVLEFDLNDNEFFMELDSIEEYLDWSNEEKIRVNKNSYCQKCKYLGHCLSEHLRKVTDIEKSCNGFYKLLEWGSTVYEDASS